jgi:hypothetical protein
MPRSEPSWRGPEVVVGEAEVPGDPDAIYTYDPALAAMADGIRRVYMAHVTRYAENATFVHEVADAFAGIQAGDVQWEEAYDDAGEPVRACWFARFGVFARPSAV